MLILFVASVEFLTHLTCLMKKPFKYMFINKLEDVKKCLLNKISQNIYEFEVENITISKKI